MIYQDVIRDFAERTRANLRAIERLGTEGVEAYETTQLLNSMLGLLVFPREEFIEGRKRLARAEDLPRLS